jgi:phosphatidylserine decarboxylase
MNGPCYEISIYLSLFDVHVNRSPISGAVGSVVYYPGKSHFAFKKNAATHNKNNVITIFNSRTRTILRQVAGRLTRRVICYCKEGDFVKQGDRIGIIELGSQIQVYIPPGFNIRVKTGDKARSGETILASSG